MNRYRIYKSLVLGLMMIISAYASGQSADSLVSVQLPSQGAGISVKATLDTGSIVIGDQKTLHIFITRDPSLTSWPKVTLPSLQQMTQGAIEALDFVADTTKDKDGSVKSIEQKVIVTTFDTGKQYIGGISVIVDNDGNSVILAPSDSLFLEASYAADADTTKCEVKAEAGVEKEPYTFWEIARWFVAALLLAAIIFVIIWIIRRRKENKPIVILPKAKPVPADKKALSELENLRRKELWQKGRIKKYYTDMTDIIRRFLRNMYGIKAAEMTTRQTLRAFHNIEDWSEESEALLRQLLQKADMVKFAKSQPESHEHDLAMQNSMDFVRKVAETHRLNNDETGEK
ncbi:MAG: DUF4381 family protein [Bacteroidales bacterium]|nr:DUF4381 family protein [Bacteroidales bacterium]